MIGIIFQFGGEPVEVRVEGTNVLFRTGQFGGAFAPIDGLKLDYNGVCREFPDLELKSDWREEAIKRFKDKMKGMNTEEDRINYIKDDLKKFGYIPLFYQKQGHRPVRLT